MKKRILFIFIAVLMMAVLVSNFSLCFAEETSQSGLLAETIPLETETESGETKETVTNDALTENLTDGGSDMADTGPEDTLIHNYLPEETQAVTIARSEHTVFSRLWEYFNAYKTEILGVVGDVAIFIVAIIIKIKNSKSNQTIAEDFERIKASNSQAQLSQNAAIDAVNKMIEGYDTMKQSYEEYGLTENDRNRVIGVLVAQNTAIMEILTTVYANSKNLPQGVKDIVNIKYANCLKSLENDEQLLAIVTAVRENISAGAQNTELETETADEPANIQDTEV